MRKLWTKDILVNYGNMTNEGIKNKIIIDAHFDCYIHIISSNVQYIFAKVIFMFKYI